MTASDDNDSTRPVNERANDRELIENAREQVERARQQVADQADTIDAPAHPSSSLPECFQGYNVVREIHRGGQGVVYQAIQKSTKRKVAIKVLLGGPYASASAKKRFEREIELVAQLKHLNIVSIFHSGVTDDGRQYCVMDYIRGKRLNDYVRDEKLPLEEVLQLFAKVCGAVNYAHQKGVIHRDLKPSNILVDTDGEPKVLDFGLARTVTGQAETLVSLTGQVVGTLPYMSPEQTRGNPDEIDIRTDVYALGVIFYELLTGHYPYPVVGQMADVLKHIAETPPTPPSRRWTKESGVTQRSGKRLRPGKCPIDTDVQTIILKTLSKERERRYQTAGDVGRDIQHYLDGEPIEARAANMVYLLRSWFRQNVRSVFWVVAVGLVCGGGGALAITLTATHTLMSRLAQAYADSVPSEAPPLLAIDLNWAPWVDVILFVLGAALLMGMGLLLALLVRPKDWPGDTISGLGAGLVAGVMSFVAGNGLACILAFSVAESISDMSKLSQIGSQAILQLAGEDVEPVETRTWGYPDFEKVPAAERPGKLFKKITADLVVGIQIGIWVGMLTSLALLGAGCTMQTVVAGFLLRRGDSVVRLVWYYFEMTTVSMGLIGAILFAVVSPVGLIVLIIPALAAAATVAIAGVKRGWDFRLRFGLYGLCAIPANIHSSPWNAVAVITVFAAISLGWHVHWRRSLRQQLLELGEPPCPVCGYDLRGQVVARCPECGNDFSSSLLRV